MSHIVVYTVRHLHAEFWLSIPSTAKDMLAAPQASSRDSTRIRFVAILLGQLYLLLLSLLSNLAMTIIVVNTVRHPQAECLAPPFHPHPTIGSTRHRIHRVVIPSRFFPECGATSIPWATGISLEFGMDRLPPDGAYHKNSHGQVSIQ
jgi:hypothetical protein